MHAFVVLAAFVACAAAAPVSLTVGGFRFVDCGPTNAPLHISNVNLSPDPIVRSIFDCVYITIIKPFLRAPRSPRAT